MKQVFYLVLLIIGGLTACHSSGKDNSNKQPNVVVFLVDDLGWTDLTCNGSDFYQTPNIDRLASKGVRFTNGYSSCTVCSPSRASYMSGKYPATLNCTDWIEGHKRSEAPLKVPDWTMYLDTAEYTLAEAFNDAGYVTGHFGKWHLGENEIYWPGNQGFEVNKGGWTWGAPNLNPSKGYKGYFSPYGNPKLSDGSDGEYLTERLTSEACDFIANNASKPFFLNFCFYNVHTSLQAKAEKVEKYKALADSSKNQMNPTYAAMVEHVDEAVGRVIGQLENHRLLENTIIVFTSDNGGLIGRGNYKFTNNTPLRLGKGHMYEGGIRVPNIISAPNALTNGSTVDKPMITMDFYPTLVELAQIDVPASVKSGWDGCSLVPLLNGETEIGREFLLWHYPHYHIEGATPYSAIRMGDWKLIYFMETETFELYNLDKDLGESNNLVKDNLDKVMELAQRLSHELRRRQAQQAINAETGKTVPWPDEKV
jgi:arylsulfatase A-like enzyme